MLVTGFGGAAFFSIHPFLAVTNRIDADVLVVEAWVREYAIQTVNYQELAVWANCIVDARNAMAGVRLIPGKVWKA